MDETGNKPSNLTEIDRVVHEPARLAILALLYVVESADFTFIMNQTGLSWGNLSTHMSKLAEAGYIEVEKSFLFYWVPFVAADLGNFFGGGASSWLIRRGWSVIKARQAFVVFGGLGMSLLACTIFTANPWVLAALFGFSTFAYAAFCTMIIVLPSDLFPSRSVATVSGMSGTGAGLGTILSTLTVGYISDHYSFAPILIGASIIPLVAMVLMLVLIRNPEAHEGGVVQPI